ncbi:MAG TPA: amidohydrolase family protein [Streptosporangiaceae bacterium]
MSLDAHHHVWDLSAREQPWLASHPGLVPLLRDFSVGDLRPLAAAAGITATVVVQTLTEPGETAELLALAAADPLVVAVVGWADLTSPDLADQLAALRELPGGPLLAGLRHPLLTEPDPGWLARPDVRRGLAVAGAAGLAFDLIAEPGQLAVAVAAAAAVPQTRFVLDHLGNAEPAPRPDPAWADAIRALAALPNTACKLSGLLSEPAPGLETAAGRGPGGAGSQPVAHLRPCYQAALDAFGPGRMMFGSDWPVCTLRASYAEVTGAARALTAGLAQAEQAAIFGQTARRIYRISDRT